MKLQQTYKKFMADSPQFSDVGKAMLDQKKFTPQTAIELIALNLERGNAEAIEAFSKGLVTVGNA